MPAARPNLKRRPATNQWLVISSTNIDYQTNLAVFHDDVRVRLLENGALRDTLDCDLLNVELVSNEVATAIARGNVRGETAPDRAGNIKTIACEVLVGAPFARHAADEGFGGQQPRGDHAVREQRQRARKTN